MSASSIGAGAGFAVAGPVGALLGFQAGLGKESLDETRKTRQAQERLEAERRRTLSAEAAAREAAAAKAATAGQRAGRGTRASLLGSLGFGSGNTQAGLTMGSLFAN